MTVPAVSVAEVISGVGRRVSEQLHDLDRRCRERASRVEVDRAGVVAEDVVIVGRTHQDGVWRVVAWALRDAGATEDLVQQVFVNAYLKLDRFEAGRDLGAWLRGIARNLVREELRRRARENRRLEVYRQQFEARLSDDESAGRHEQALRDALEHCSQKLGGAARQALDSNLDLLSRRRRWCLALLNQSHFAFSCRVD